MQPGKIKMLCITEYGKLVQGRECKFILLSILLSRFGLLSLNIGNIDSEDIFATVMAIICMQTGVQSLSLGNLYL